MTVSLSDVERETVFMDDLMLVINDVFNSGVVLDRGTILAKATAVSLGLEFVFAGKVTVKGKCLMRWSVLRPKLHGLCIDLLAELQQHFEANTGEAAQDPASIGSTLFQVLEQDDTLDGDDAGKTWFFSSMQIRLSTTSSSKSLARTISARQLRTKHCTIALLLTCTLLKETRSPHQLTTSCSALLMLAVPALQLA